MEEEKPSTVAHKATGLLALPFRPLPKALGVLGEVKGAVAAGQSNHEGDEAEDDDGGDDDNDNGEKFNKKKTCSPSYGFM